MYVNGGITPNKRIASMKWHIKGHWVNGGDSTYKAKIWVYIYYTYIIMNIKYPKKYRIITRRRSWLVHAQLLNI